MTPHPTRPARPDRPVPTTRPHAPRRVHRARHPVHAPTAPSTRPRSAGSSAGRSWPASTASSRAARPASPPPCRPTERERLIATTVEVAAERPSRDRDPVVAGTGTNDTAATIRATRRAAELGADAALVVAPYYNRPDGRMLEAHFRAVADEGDLPIVVYNVPSRTGANVDADTFLRLAEHPRIVAVKEASGNLEQIARICRDRPRDVAVLAGDDAWTLPMLALGGDGVVSVASNEIPGELVALCAAARAGDWDAARRIHDRWLPLFLGNFRGGPNPVPVKAALAPDGPARVGHGPGAAPAAGEARAWRRWPRRCGGSAWSRRPAAGSRPPTGPARAQRGRGMSRRVTTDTARRSSPIDPATILADLEAGRRPGRRARSDGARRLAVRPEVKTAILACFADRTDDRLGGRAADRSATGPAVPPRHDLAGGPWRIVPGGTAVRARRPPRATASS